MPVTYAQRWGDSRLERARRIMAGPRRIHLRGNAYVVPSQRFPYRVSYRVYMTEDGLHCGQAAATRQNTKGCLDKLYRHGRVPHCKHELAVQRQFPQRRSRRIADRERPAPRPRARPRGPAPGPRRPTTRSQSRLQTARGARLERRRAEQDAQRRRRG